MRKQEEDNLRHGLIMLAVSGTFGDSTKAPTKSCLRNI